VTEDRDPWTAAREIDQRVRIAAFEFLRSQTELRGEVLPRGILAEGFLELLDAAHILPDRHPMGAPTVSNGLALCKLHHAAFDGQILGVRPDLVVQIREDILREKDGPMLLHGLQGFQGSQILIPTRRDLQPDRDFLAERYEIFRKAV
jgi:predicted restriction endonuclease